MKKLILFLLILQFSLYAIGQDKSDYTLSLDHFALSVKDVDKASEFYGTILNLKEITNKTKVDGIRWFSLGDGKELHLISTVKEDVTVNKAVHLAFTTPDFDSFIQKLKSMHITYSDWPGTLNKISIRADGIKQVYVQDPDDYWIEVNSVGEKN